LVGLVMFSFWLLTFRQDGHRNETQMAWAGVVAYVAVAGAAWGLLAQLVRRKLEEARTGPNPYGDPRHEFMLLLGVLIPSFLLLTFQFLVHPEASQWMAGLFNLAFLLALVWMIYTGYLRQIPLLINTGFFLFAITLTARFVDTLWSLLARSYVMMFSGLVLLGLAFVLEKTRRGLLSRMGSPSGEVQ
ncbi:MAG: hypothetical protein OEW12_07370, partial [Deltaproteobacteria bacterium]|nr:hypothetical protein [Deltaproteobacteria bacterium]